MFSITGSTRVLANVPFRRLAATASVSARHTSTRYYTSTMHDNDPDVLEREKGRNLSRSKVDKTATPHEHAPGWNETLASASEAAVKADKAPGDPETLQSTTIKYMKARRVETEGETSTQAYYSKDEVSGPLKDAEGRDVKDEMTTSEEDVKADRGEI